MEENLGFANISIDYAQNLTWILDQFGTNILQVFIKLKKMSSDI